jgi:hypothetical protein
MVRVKRTNTPISEPGGSEMDMNVMIDAGAWVLGVLAFVGAVFWLVRLVAADGSGTRPAPASMADWTAHGLPSRPYGT